MLLELIFNDFLDPDISNMTLYRCHKGEPTAHFIISALMPGKNYMVILMIFNIRMILKFFNFSI